MKYGFVYIWYDCARSKQNGPDKIKRWYIGAHWGREDDGYVCSSNWMRSARKRREQDFQRRILISNILSKGELWAEEEKWLNLIKKEELGKKYYNLRRRKYDIEFSDEVKERIRKSNKGRPSSRKGVRLSEETKKKIGIGNKGKRRTEEEKENLRIKNKGRKNTKEQIEKIRQSRIGIPRKEETKQRVTQGLKEYWRKKKEDERGRCQKSVP